jgi:hypothetical protein
MLGKKEYQKTGKRPNYLRVATRFSIAASLAKANAPLNNCSLLEQGSEEIRSCLYWDPFLGIPTARSGPTTTGKGDMHVWGSRYGRWIYCGAILRYAFLFWRRCALSCSENQPFDDRYQVGT